jgi:hypothetical protein
MEGVRLMKGRWEAETFIENREAVDSVVISLICSGRITLLWS